MNQCFGYVRVSTAKQGEGVSLDAQREAIEHFAARNDISIVKWFAEKETAAKAGRPVFNNMIQLLKRRRADGVVMHKIDRSARNFADWSKIGDLADAGIDVHFATESLDFRSRGGRLSADIQAVIAADYIRNLREETIKGLIGRLKQGLYPFKAPIGYLDNGRGKPKTIDPVRGPLVRQAFELYGSGQHSLRSLLAELHQRGLRSVSQRRLSKHGLESILSNPFYCGLILIRRTGETYVGRHDRLITVALYQRVQAVRAGKAGKKITKHQHLYRGLFQCRDCKGSMTPERQKGFVYYRCQRPLCSTKCIREETITDALHGFLEGISFSGDRAELLKTEMERWWQRQRDENKTKTLRMRLGHIDQRLERLTDVVIDGTIDRAAYSARKETLLLEKLAIEAAINAEKDNHDSGRFGDFLELMKTLKNLYISLEDDEKRELVDLTTSNRTVSGKSVALEPQNWLLEAKNACSVPFGDPYRPTSRRLPELANEQLEKLAELIRSSEFERLRRLLRKKAA